MVRFGEVQMDSKEILVGGVETNWEVYPRANYDLELAKQYAQAMRAGAVFPPIKVATVEDTVVIIDGKHRLEAKKINRTKTISHIDLGVLSVKDALIEAIKYNADHGHGLNRNWVVEKLQVAGFSLESIGKALSIPKGELNYYLPQKMKPACRLGLDQEGKPRGRPLKGTTEETRKWDKPDSSNLLDNLPQFPKPLHEKPVVFDPFETLNCPLCDGLIQARELRKRGPKFTGDKKK
jgi:hypothetical protein